MKNFQIRTADIFKNCDGEYQKKLFNACYKRALKSGLMCRVHIDDEYKVLYMAGHKNNFIKYYIKTMFINKPASDGLKRLVEILNTKQRV